MTPDAKLDNPVWYSLSESHRHFAIHFENIKFYDPDYCPFGAVKQFEHTSAPLLAYADKVESFFIVGEKPTLPHPLKLKNELVCLQMVCAAPIKINMEGDIIKLEGQHSNQLIELVNLVQPGYFKKKTFRLGNYYGIFKNNSLVAVTGERMQMASHTEVSAVVTHPDYTGKGYAKQLVAYTVNSIHQQTKNPFLHVAETNVAAITLYEKLGFKTRRKISFWHLEK